MFREIVTAFCLFVLLSTGAVIAQEKKAELPFSGWGTLKGIAVYEGKPPAPEDFTPRMKMHNDAACCLAGKGVELIDQTWLVNKKNAGVANVFVYLKPPVGTFFKVKDADKVRTDVVTMDQPHCAFMPHAVALYPVYFDGKKHKATGQVFKVLNSAPVVHNFRITGDPGAKNLGLNQNMPAKTELTLQVNPQRLPLLVNCDFHKWMSAKVMVFDHPYFAITKEDGTYEIANVPTGAPLSVHAWHEGVGYVIGGSKGIPTTLKEGVNVQDFKLKSAD